MRNQAFYKRLLKAYLLASKAAMQSAQRQKETTKLITKNNDKT